MQYSAHSKDITGKLVFLGTGTSHGVPIIGCKCPTCTSSNPKNSRTRCSVALGLPQGNLLIDTTPELRLQLLAQDIGLVHAVLYTHAHADHLFGFDDLRIFSRYLGRDVPVYCEKHVEEQIRNSFAYAFDPIMRKYPAGGVPRLQFQEVTEKPFEILGQQITPIRTLHGASPTLGYRIGDLAYCTDVKSFPPESMALLEGLDMLILDCLRPEPHATHLGLDEAIGVTRGLGARRTLFTHMGHRLEHEATNRSLPSDIRLAYDGLCISLTPNSA